MLDIEVKQILRAIINKLHNILYTHMFIDIQNNSVGYTLFQPHTN